MCSNGFRGARGLRARGVGLLGLIAFIAPFAQGAERLTLEQAWQMAEQSSPRLRSAVAELAAAEGQVTDVRGPLWNNPELAAEWRNRNITESTTSGSRNEGSFGIAQRLQLLGQQGVRRRIAGHNLDALRASIAETRRDVRAEVEQRFVEVLALQLRVDTETQTLKVVEDASTLVQKRFKAGQDNRLDANLARIEAERAKNQVAALREELLRARATLAAALQLPPGREPEAAGTLDAGPLPYTLETLLQSAPERPGLKALALREQAARAQLDLERKLAHPDITLGLSLSRENGLQERDDIIGLSVAIPLPVYRKNAAGIGRAASDLGKVQIDRMAANRDVRAQVIALWEQLQSLQARVAQISTSILPALQENQRLSLRALQVGEIGLPQLLLVSRQLFDGRRDLIDAQSALRTTRVALESTAAWPADDMTPSSAGTARRSGAQQSGAQE